MLNEMVIGSKETIKNVANKSKQWYVSQTEGFKTASQTLIRETEDAGSVRIAKVTMSLQAQRQADLQRQQLQHQQEMIRVKEKVCTGCKKNLMQVLDKPQVH